MKRIVVCGLGKLGSPIAAILARSELNVVGLDLDASKVDAINAGRAPVSEQGLGEYISKSVACGHLMATTKAEEAVPGSEACIFITPTPSKSDGSFDSGPLLWAIENVLKHVDRPGYLFVIASTVTPGTCTNEILPILELKGQQHLIYKPEFIALGSVIRDLTFPDFNLIGESSPEAGELAVSIYGNTRIKRMSLVEAELAKISLNCFVTMKISFANQLSVVAENYGASANKILDAIGQDHRIGNAALKPGMAYGGPCFPRDNRMFVYSAKQVGVEAFLSKATDDINDAFLWRIAIQARDAGTGDIGILGLAYKPGTMITEESPGVRLKQRLESLGRTVRTHDPVALHSHSLEEVVACPILIVATPWPEYENIPCLEGWQDQVLFDPMHVIRGRTVRLQRKAV